jgi:hypothetical protein
MGCELVRLQERDAERIGVILGLDFIGEFQNRSRQFLMLHSHTVRKSRGVQPRVVHCHSLPLRPPRLLHSPANQPLLSLPRPFLPLSVVTPPPFSTSPPPPTPPTPSPVRHSSTVLDISPLSVSHASIPDDIPTATQRQETQNPNVQTPQISEKTRRLRYYDMELGLRWRFVGLCGMSILAATEKFITFLFVFIIQHSCWAAMSANAQL